MNHSEKLLELCDIKNLRDYSEPQTPEEFIQTGTYYRDILNKVTERGEEHLKRVEDELIRLLAEVLQPLAREKFGKADASSIKALLTAEWESKIGSD